MKESKIEKISDEKGKELAVFNPMDSFSAEENLEGTNPRLPKISIVHQGQMFKVGIDEKKESEIVGVIVDTSRVNAYWKEDYSVGASAPDCSSRNAIKPDDGENQQADSCLSYPMNQFGSDGRGKACKNLRRLHILLPDEFLPLRLTMTSSSLRAWDDYMMMLTQKQLNYWYARTKITLEAAKNKDGIEFSKMKFEFIEPVTNAKEAANIMDMRKRMVDQMRNEEVETEEYVSKEETKDEPF